MRRFLGKGAVIGAVAALLLGCARPDQDRRSPLDVAQEIEVAQAAASVGDYAEAARLYEKAAERTPMSLPILNGLGASYISLGQYSRAENALLRARQLHPREVEALNLLGKLALQQRDPARAFGYFSDATGLERRNLDALTGKAVALDYLSRHAEAAVVYAEALQTYPTNFVLLSNAALSMVIAGQHDKGISLMEELHRDPNMGGNITTNLAIAYALQGDEAKARQILRKVMSGAEAERALRLYRQARQERAAGKPIGHLIFE